MIDRIYASLPGPRAVRVLLIVVLLVAILLALFFIYDRIGLLIDSGGGIG